MTYADRLARYCNQSAALERAAEPDAWGDSAYSAPQTIPVRREQTGRLVRDAMGNTVASDTTVFCTTALAPGDRLDGRTVISVANMVDRQGVVRGYEAYL